MTAPFSRLKAEESNKTKEISTAISSLELKSFKERLRGNEKNQILGRGSLVTLVLNDDTSCLI